MIESRLEAGCDWAIQLLKNAVLEYRAVETSCVICFISIVYRDAPLAIAALVQI